MLIFLDVVHSSILSSYEHLMEGPPAGSRRQSVFPVIFIPFWGL